MKKNPVLPIFLTAILVLFLSQQLALAATKMPSWNLENVRDGSKVASESFAGKVLLVTFFATWCAPCVQEVPVLNQLQSEFAASGFSVIGLSVDQHGSANVAKFVEEEGVSYPVLMARSKTTKDFGGVYGIPVAFLVNKSGTVVKKYTGYVQQKILAKDIRSLLD
jgi:thiol-disulfide isomerase/thioredoxin